MITKEDFLNDFNDWLELKIEEAKRSLPKLVEGTSVERPEGLVIEDIDIQDVSWKIPKNRGCVGEEMSFYTIHIKDVGPIQVFDESVGMEPFIGDFQCYYEDYETLIIDEVMDVDNDEAKRIEEFFNNLEIVNLLSENAPKFFLDYLNQQREADKEEIRTVASNYYGLEFQFVEFAGSDLLLYTDKELPMHINTEYFTLMSQELDLKRM